jgi:hypothetical protein
MRDLFVLAADADMKAVFKAILRRPEALGIRPINSFVDKHPWRDPGVFGEGPEFIRRTIPKNDYRHFILAFDYDGSGCKRAPDECARVVQERLDSFTFKDRSMAVAIAPKLEAWLWHDPPAIASASAPARFPVRKKDCGRSSSASLSRATSTKSPFAPTLQAWDSSPSFRMLKTTLQNWFPIA